MITREEIIELCNKFGLVELHNYDENYRFWSIKSPLFKNQEHGVMIILSRDPFANVIGKRFYFYDQLNKKFVENNIESHILNSVDPHNSYISANGVPYMEFYNKESLEFAIKRLIRKIKKTEVNEKLNDLKEDFV